MTFNKNIAGKIYGSDSEDAALYTLRADGRFAGATIDSSAGGVYTRVTLTGWQMVAMSGKTMYQTTSGEYIEMSEGWQYISTTTHSVAQAQRLVDQIIANNRTIIANNLLCARYANKLTPDQIAQVRQLQRNLETRNNALIDAGVCSGLSKSYPEDYIDLQPYLDSLMKGHEISGIGSVTVAIIVTAVVIASLSTAAYFAFKYYAEQSAQDVKFSKDLTKILTSKLTPEEYQQLLNETQGKLTKTRILSNLGAYGKAATLALVGVGAYFLYKILTKKKND